MTPAKLHKLCFAFCLIAAVVGVIVTVVYASMFVASACCDASFFFITGRFAVDFVFAPLMAGLSLARFGVAGRAGFWGACAWMAFMVWPPYLWLLTACCIWTRVRLSERRPPATAVAS